MRNTQYTLKDKIPPEIRLETYKAALSWYEDNSPNKKHWGRGLCLVLPCALWNLDIYLRNMPNGATWDWKDTEEAFPEIKDSIQLVKKVSKFFEYREFSEINLLRIASLKKAINQLESK